MSNDDFDLPIDPQLDDRLRRTLSAVAATVTDDGRAHDKLDQPTIPMLPAAVTLIGRDTRRKRRQFRPVRVTAVAASAAAAVAILAVAIGVAPFAPSADRPAPEAIALGDGGLSAPLRDGGNVCLAEARRIGQLGPNERPHAINYVDHDWLPVVIYQADDRLIYCTVNKKAAEYGATALGSVSGVNRDDLLRGPITPDLMETQGVEGEYMAVAGRVGSRVGRVVFDDGAGHTRQARLANGTFATAGSYRNRHTAVLITYDQAGKEIDRRLAFGASCLPMNKAGDQQLPGTNCKDQERWKPRSTPERI